jgi:predicted transglutaminase-like cysteine proteinase
VALSSDIMGFLRRPRAARGRPWLSGIAPILWFSVTLVVAEGIYLGPEVLQAVREKYGAPALERVQEWQRLMRQNQDKSESEKLGLVNDFFNRLRFTSDIKLWGKVDYWATPIEAMGRGAADCEDYSIAKYFTLRELGIPDAKMRIMYVKALKLNQAHMVLTYYATPGAVPLVLDNLNKRILPADKRKDLAPVYSFNGDGLWLAKKRDRGLRVGTSERINLWQDLKARMKRELGNDENQ